jgi:uncharacterized protein YceH (UPF0502 family)
MAAITGAPDRCRAARTNSELAERVEKLELEIASMRRLLKRLKVAESADEAA